MYIIQHLNHYTILFLKLPAVLLKIFVIKCKDICLLFVHKLYAYIYYTINVYD